MLIVMRSDPRETVPKETTQNGYSRNKRVGRSINKTKTKKTKSGQHYPTKEHPTHNKQKTYQQKNLESQSLI